MAENHGFTELVPDAQKGFPDFAEISQALF